MPTLIKIIRIIILAIEHAGVSTVEEELGRGEDRQLGLSSDAVVLVS